MTALDGAGTQEPCVPVRRHVPQVSWIARLGELSRSLCRCFETIYRRKRLRDYDSGTTPYLGLFSSLKATTRKLFWPEPINTDIGLKHDVNGYLTSITMGRPGLLKNIANMYL